MPRKVKKKTGSSLPAPIIEHILHQSYTGNSSSINGFEYIPDLSDQKIQVYRARSGAQIIFSVRGSYSLQDWILDYQLWNDSKYRNERINSANERLKLVKMRYPGIPITGVGHSLGGFIAELLAPEVFETIGVNPYIPKGQILKKIPDNAYIVRSKVDAASLLSFTQRRKNIIDVKPESINPFTEHSYAVLKRLGDLVIGRKA